MHIAICDDNIADRKQTERLLGRESDRRAKTDKIDAVHIDHSPLLHGWHRLPLESRSLF